MNEDITKLFSILLSEKPSEQIIKNEEFVFSLIPELKLSKGFNQNNKWHIYDVYNHILRVVDGVPSDLSLRLSALFHDIGKPFAYYEDEQGQGHFHGHWIKSQEIFLNFAKDNNLDAELSMIVSKLVFYHDLNIGKLDGDSLVNFVNELGGENIEKYFFLKRSDLLAHSPLAHYKLDEYDKQEAAMLKLRK